jgi:hypothetical protein
MAERTERTSELLRRDEWESTGKRQWKVEKFEACGKYDGGDFCGRRSFILREDREIFNGAHGFDDSGVFSSDGGASAASFA